MHIRILTVTSSLLGGALAATHNLTGSFSTFKAESMAPGARTVGNLYDSCKEFDQDGELVSIGRGCIETLLRNTYQVLFAATQVQPVDVIHNGTVLKDGTDAEHKSPDTPTTSLTISAVSTAPSSSSPVDAMTKSSSQSTSPGSYGINDKRASDSAGSKLMESMNDKLSELFGTKHGVRAVEIIESEFHPSDGIAIRTNIHGDNAVMHVHTNGSHATAEFRKETVSRMTRRDQDITMAHNFQFSEQAFGIKMQVTKINRINPSMSDMHAYWTAFGYGNGEVGLAPAFNGSDSWKFVVCDNGWRQLIAGKVIALEGPSDYGYESIDESIACM